MQSSYYDLLGVSMDAGAEQVKSAYRAKARIVHPDAGGSAEEFVRLTQAYDTLSDPFLRAEYDRTLKEFAERGGYELCRYCATANVISGRRPHCGHCGRPMPARRRSSARPKRPTVVRAASVIGPEALDLLKQALISGASHALSSYLRKRK